MLTSLFTAVSGMDANSLSLSVIGDNIANANTNGKSALVLGAEGPGLRRLVKEHCDGLLALPMHGPMPSINVSNAAAVALYEFSKD